MPGRVVDDLLEGSDDNGAAAPKNERLGQVAAHRGERKNGQNEYEKEITNVGKSGKERRAERKAVGESLEEIRKDRAERKRWQP